MVCRKRSPVTASASILGVSMPSNPGLRSCSLALTCSTCTSAGSLATFLSQASNGSGGGVP